MLAETDEPFQQLQHLNFHDGWWKNVITEDTWLGLALLSGLCHSIDSCSNRQVSQSLKLQKMPFGMSAMPLSGYLVLKKVGSDIERGKRLRVRRAILCYLYGAMFQTDYSHEKEKKEMSQPTIVHHAESTSPWQCNVHHCCLREARYLMNHIFDIQEASTSFLTSRWHLEVSVLLHNTATVTWGTFSMIFSHHFSGPQISIDPDRSQALSALIGQCVNNKLYLQP